MFTRSVQPTISDLLEQECIRDFIKQTLADLDKDFPMIPSFLVEDNHNTPMHNYVYNKYKCSNIGENIEKKLRFIIFNPFDIEDILWRHIRVHHDVKIMKWKTQWNKKDLDNKSQLDKVMETVRDWCSEKSFESSSLTVIREYLCCGF
jgi:hypothetical protein